MGQSELPIKKSVELRWQGRRLAFDVAQDLFSSYQVDRGSRMLLDSLDPDTFPASGHAADFGCGYGVLGIAWQARLPSWSMHYVDRDALAVAFSRHNVSTLISESAGMARFTCDISIPEAPGYDLVLWNVPGKAGRPVISGLLDAVVDALAPSGLLAVVVVHPLADVFTNGFERRDAEIIHADRGKEHTVVHIRRTDGVAAARDPFVDGLFDRPVEDFSAGALRWELTPVIGLPEYGSLGHATELAVQAMIDHRRKGSVDRWMVLEPGVGHLAVAARLLWPEAGGLVHGRDALAIRSTRRALGDPVGVEASPSWGIAALDEIEPVDIAVAALPEQSRPDDLAELLSFLGGCIAADGAVILHGRSTEVARVERLSRRSSNWRTSRPEKLRGSASIIVRRG